MENGSSFPFVGKRETVINVCCVSKRNHLCLKITLSIFNEIFFELKGLSHQIVEDLNWNALLYINNKKRCSR